MDKEKHLNYQKNIVVHLFIEEKILLTGEGPGNTAESTGGWMNMIKSKCVHIWKTITLNPTTQYNEKENKRIHFFKTFSFCLHL